MRGSGEGLTSHTPAGSRSKVSSKHVKIEQTGKNTTIKSAIYTRQGIYLHRERMFTRNVKINIRILLDTLTVYSDATMHAFYNLLTHADCNYSFDNIHTFVVRPCISRYKSQQKQVQSGTDRSIIISSSTELRLYSSLIVVSFVDAEVLSFSFPWS